MKTLTAKILDNIRQDYKKYNQFMDKKRKLTDYFKGDEKELAEYLLNDIILSIVTASSIGIDLVESLEQYYKGQSIRIWIPIVPPGINSTYGVNCKSKQKVYKTKEAKDWEQAAILPIRNAANYGNFLINKNDKLAISILIKGSQHDVDAPVKMILDTVARTLDFDDKIVKRVNSETKRDSSDRGVLIEIEKLND